MPKVQKELKKDQISMQQEVLRRVRRPGIPQDVGPLPPGSQIRSPSSNAATVGHAFINALAAHSSLIAEAALNSLVSETSLIASAIISSVASETTLVALSFLNSIATDVAGLVTYLRKEVLSFTEKTFKKVISQLTDEIQLTDGGNIDWYEDGVGWHYGYRTW